MRETRRRQPDGRGGIAHGPCRPHRRRSVTPFSGQAGHWQAARLGGPRSEELNAHPGSHCRPGRAVGRRGAGPGAESLLAAEQHRPDDRLGQCLAIPHPGMGTEHPGAGAGAAGDAGLGRTDLPGLLPRYPRALRRRDGGRAPGRPCLHPGAHPLRAGRAARADPAAAGPTRREQPVLHLGQPHGGDDPRDLRLAHQQPELGQ